MYIYIYTHMYMCTYIYIYIYIYIYMPSQGPATSSRASRAARTSEGDKWHICITTILYYYLYCINTLLYYYLYCVNTILYYYLYYCINTILIVSIIIIIVVISSSSSSSSSSASSSSSSRTNGIYVCVYVYNVYILYVHNMYSCKQVLYVYNIYMLYILQRYVYVCMVNITWFTAQFSLLWLKTGWSGGAAALVFSEMGSADIYIYI